MVKPTVICLTETHMGQEETIEITGYKVFTNNRNRGGGGVLIGVKEELGSVTVEVKSEKATHESIWIKIDNGRVRIRMGVVYMPQESKCKVEEIEEIYKSVKEEVRKAEAGRERVMLVGDFNCKIGNLIPGNTNEVAKAGKYLDE